MRQAVLASGGSRPAATPADNLRMQSGRWACDKILHILRAASVFHAFIARILDTSADLLSRQGEAIVGGSLGVEAVLPEVVQATTAIDAA